MSEIHYTDATKCIKWSWDDFSPKEFSCKCCGNLFFNKDVAFAWDCLQEFRNIVDTPVIINSAYRCDNHNKTVGGVYNSYHKKGVAFDIKITPKLTRHSIHTVSRKCGFTGIGDYNRFVHIDTGRDRYWDLRT